MKITAISDLHGNLIKIDPCDYLLICGDISPLDIQKDYNQMARWFLYSFLQWVETLPCKGVIMTPGNHDFWFQKIFFDTDIYTIGKLTILIDGQTTITSDEGTQYTVYGTPQCKDFGKWAFMPGNSRLESIYDEIPDRVDILISHDSPQLNHVGNILERKSEGMPFGVPAGNTILAEAILRKKPKYVFCGHIHSGDHELNEINGTKIANVSILDEGYNIGYEPLTINI